MGAVIPMLTYGHISRMDLFIILHHLHVIQAFFVVPCVHAVLKKNLLLLPTSFKYIALIFTVCEIHTNDKMHIAALRRATMLTSAPALTPLLIVKSLQCHF